MLCTTTLDINFDQLLETLKQNLLPESRVLSSEAPLLWWVLNNEKTSDTAATGTFNLLTLPKYLTTLRLSPAGPPQSHKKRKTDAPKNKNDPTDDPTALMYALFYLTYIASNDDTPIDELRMTWGKLITYFPMMDVGHSETDMALFLLDVLTGNRQGLDVEELDVNLVVEEILQCGYVWHDPCLYERASLFF